MLFSSAFAGLLTEFIRHTRGPMPETLGLVIFGMTMFIVSTGIRRRGSLTKSSDSIREVPLEKTRHQSDPPARLPGLHPGDVEIPKQLASL